MKPASTHQVRRVGVDGLGQRGVEGLARGEAAVVDHGGGDALRRGPGQPRRVGAVGEHGHDTRRPAFGGAALRRWPRRLEPRPLMRMTMRFMAGRAVCDFAHAAAPAGQCTGLTRIEGSVHALPVHHAIPRPFRHAPHRRPAPRPLPRRPEELGAAAGRVRLLLLRRRLARADHALRRARGDGALCLRHGDRLARRRPGPGQGHDLHPEPPARARRAVHAAGDGHAAGLARARADLQGPDRQAQGPRPGDLRLSRLPAAAGRRHPDLQGHLRAGGRGPGLARRTDARGGAPLQPPVRPRTRISRPSPPPRWPSCPRTTSATSTSSARPMAKPAVPRPWPRARAS